ncbi:MAG: radical SAM protein [Candidatus Paceibacterota bacterium]
MKKRADSVCFIIPPSAFLLDERVFISIGVLKVAAVLEQSGYGVEVLDLSGVANYADMVCDYLSRRDIFVFGITATTPQMPAVVKIANAIRQNRPTARIILGGPHATLVNAAYKNERRKNIDGRAAKAFSDLTAMFDVVVAGDGENAIFAALEAGVSKVVDADDLESGLFLDNSRLNGFPFPARHLIDVNSYHYSIDGERALSIIGQLGCPFDCGFCGGRKSPTFHKTRTRSVENIVQEIELLYKTYGVKGFMFYDDELNLKPKTFVSLMNAVSDLQSKLGVDFRLRGFIRANLFSEEQARAMFRAGFRWLLVGFESGSDKMLLSMNKKSTKAQNTACVEIAKKSGLKVKALMSIGHPGESENTVMETREWLLDVRPDDFDAAVISVYPGTAYYDDAVLHSPGIWVYTHNGERLYSVEVDYLKIADYYKGNPDGGYKSYVYTDYLSTEKIVSLRDYLERDVRNGLKIPFNLGAPAKRYEHSMGTK